MPDGADAALAASGGAPGYLDVLLLAAVQGLTEFLPVSSSGHLVLVGKLFEVPEAGLLLSVALHVGTLGAVFAVYGGDLWRVLVEALGRQPRELVLLALGTVPAVVVGLGFHDPIERAFASPRVAAFGLLATAVLLATGDRLRRPVPADGAQPRRRLGVGDALWMGAAQALAIVPGISRSGSTISVGLVRGLDAAAAARFSFLLSVPAVGGAALLEGREVLEAGTGGLGPGVLAAAVLASWLVGWVALKLLLVVLERGSFRWFAVYCAVLGSVSLAIL